MSRSSSFDGASTTPDAADANDAVARRARLEEVQPLATADRRELVAANLRMEPPLPTGAVFWIAELAGGSGDAVGYAAETLRAEAETSSRPPRSSPRPPR